MSSSKSQNLKKQRKIFRLESAENKYFIFCEGEQTEPLYFTGFKKAIENNALYKNLVHIEIEGVGADTLRILEVAKKAVFNQDIRNAQIWCVYDKDSFLPEDFNEVENQIRNLNQTQNNVVYKAAWSNQCIEYWFILHFGWYCSDNDRKYYRSFLHKIFKELKWVRYEKDNSQLFNILTESGNPKQAIKWAKKRIGECEGMSCSNSVPATKVYALAEELAKFLPEDIRQKYI